MSCIRSRINPQPLGRSIIIQITIVKAANTFEPLELAPFSTDSLDTFVIFFKFY
jgi:hypothetical protein